ncbi:glycoside hydrolase family 26 protein [Kitasatospora sp. NPDC059571]|uniref:glycoside hydrolase family 26 protein n=1 Tax=Kitasatospora sp. NPDC059571 TaxID=3346871 RepID=UPI003689D7D5
MLPRALRSRAAIPVAAVTAAALCTAVVLMGGDGGAAPAPGAAPSGTGSSHLVPARPLPASLGADLVKRDPKASPNARAVYQMLADLESQARDGHPKGTVIGHHVEAQNELYNLNYGDYQGIKGVGYYYKKAADITGKLPGFVETDLGPGYGQGDWGVGNPRSYSKDKWPTCSSKWQYTDDAVDLLTAVWSGHPRPDDGTYGASGVQQNCDGSTTSLPDNGGGPAGLVGMSFHEPYPGSPVKSFDRVLCANSPAATDPTWFGRVVDDSAGTAEHRQLLTDLSYLADHLQYLADHDVPVLFRPYHEMNNADCRHSFWWSGQRGADYQKLWRITYDYLVRTRGLHNLIFVWSPVSWDGAPGVDPWNYYPGEQYVDVVGVDDYSGSPRDPIGTGEVWTKRYYDGLAAYRKPRILAESFAVPVNARQKETLTRTPWTLWTVWGQALTEKNLIPDQVVNSLADVKATYNSKQAITGGYGHFGANFDWSSLHIQ